MRQRGSFRLRSVMVAIVIVALALALVVQARRSRQREAQLAAELQQERLRAQRLHRFLRLSVDQTLTRVAAQQLPAQDLRIDQQVREEVERERTRLRRVRNDETSTEYQPDAPDSKPTIQPSRKTPE